MGGASYNIDRGEKDRESSLGEPRQAEVGPIYSPGNSESRKAQILEPTGWVQGAEGSCVSFPLLRLLQPRIRQIWVRKLAQSLDSLCVPTVSSNLSGSQGPHLQKWG